MIIIAYATLQVSAALFDFFVMRIPNIFPAALALLFLIASLPNEAAVDWGDHLGAGALVVAGGAVMFRLRLIGGGDVKLLAATAMWMGLPLVVQFLAITAIFGGLLVLILKLVSSTLLALLSQLQTIDPRRIPAGLAGGRGVPYGVAIAAAALVLLHNIPASIRPF